MSEADPGIETEAVAAEVRDVLAHFYDQAHLLNHPLLARMCSSLGPDATVAVQELRRLLARAIQDLRPSADAAPADAAWRPYLVLHRRFILAKDLATVEKELALGRRQLMREQRRGLLAVAAALLRPGAGGDSPLADEVSRLGSHKQGVELVALLAGAVGAVSALAERNGVAIDVPPVKAPIHVVSSVTVLRQLLVAALSLAVRSCPGGSVRVTAARSAEQATVTLLCRPSADGWPGAPPELPHSLVTLAESQGSRLSLEAEDGRAILSVSLPAAATDRLVALVEDNEDVVHLFERSLAGRGFRLLSIADSREALAGIAAALPDVVVLDVMMSDVDGWEILQRLKADPGLRRIPVVVCSVLDEPELAYSIGADAYLRKPVRSVQLLDCLSALLRC
ncbi:MAG: response regulator [Anaerolineae bacterium]